MSTTGNEKKQPIQVAPPSTEDEIDPTTSETELSAETLTAPSPGMATHPTIKNS